MKGKLLWAGKISLGLAASSGLLWLVVRGLDWGLVYDSLEGVSISLILLALAIFMGASYLRAFRWQLLFVNHRISTLRLFVIQNIGIGLNNVSPVRVASEPTQLAILTIRDRIPGATALATLGIERVLDVIASTLILVVAFFLIPEMKNFTIYVWGAVGFTVVAVAIVRFVAWGSAGVSFIRRIPFVSGFAIPKVVADRVLPFVSSFAIAVRDLERERVRLSASLLVSVVYWIIVGVTAWTIARAINLPISGMTATLVIMATIFFATAVPAAPSAIGTFEFAVVYILEFFGVEKEASFGFAVVTHAVFFLPPTIIAAVFLPLEGIVSFRGIRGLTIRSADVASGSVPRRIDP